MKKYKKKEKGKKAKTKLLQIRLSENEHKKVIEFIEKFGVTQREWLLAVLDDLREANLLIKGQFYTDWKSYAYLNTDKWDKQLKEDSKCEECGATYDRAKDWENRGTKQLERHHYLGYEGDNAFKVKILCRPCHWKTFKKEIH
jgi:hypothetical protein